MTRTTTQRNMKNIKVVQSPPPMCITNRLLHKISEVIESNDETNFTQATDGYEVHAQIWNV